MARAQAITLRPAIQRIFTQDSHAVLELLIARWRLQRIEVNRLALQLLGDELLSCAAAERAQTLQTLCTELVDYVSTGHFEIYGRVLPRKLRNDPDLHALLQHIFHSIGRSTDAVLAFNDRWYSSTAMPIRPFRQLLLRLNRALQLRFALEEQLLDLCGH
jgi:regulator of sigma D